MPRHLSADCITEIFEYLEQDKFTLHSCLLVNRLWCQVAVKILWRNIWSVLDRPHRTRVSLSILGTLISCLPNESINILHKNGIFIQTPTSKPPLFNYPTFCRVLTIFGICKIINDVLKNQEIFFTSPSLKDSNRLVAQEIIKMFMNQVPLLKKLCYWSDNNDMDLPNYIAFTHYPESRDFLKDLLVLNCHSNINSEFLYQLSRICHNIQSLNIIFARTVSNGLNDLISSQNNLKHLSLIRLIRDYLDEWTDIIPSLSKHINTLIKLEINGIKISKRLLTFISKFTNLRELVLLYNPFEDFEDKKLSYISFPQLQTLKFSHGHPKGETLIKFLENNGRNLKEFHVCNYDFPDNSLNLAIAEFCTNLRSLSTTFMFKERKTLEKIFNGCKQLESIKICCGHIHLDEKEFFEVLVRCSPKSFYKLRLVNYSDSILGPEDLEGFFTKWKNRTPQKSIYFIVSVGYCKNFLEVNKENKKIIEKYKRKGIIKEFKTKTHGRIRNLSIGH